MFEMKMSESNEIASTCYDVKESTECFDAIELLYYSHSSAPEHQYTQYDTPSAAKRIEWCEQQQQQTQLQQQQKHRKFSVSERE